MLHPRDAVRTGARRAARTHREIWSLALGQLAKRACTRYFATRYACGRSSPGWLARTFAAPFGGWSSLLSSHRPRGIGWVIRPRRGLQNNLGMRVCGKFYPAPSSVLAPERARLMRQLSPCSAQSSAKRSNELHKIALTIRIGFAISYGDSNPRLIVKRFYGLASSVWLHACASLGRG